MKYILVVLLLASAASTQTMLDTFGITKIYATKAGTVEWNSAHWNNGIPRLIQYDGDIYDPTGWTDNHSSSSGDSLYIDGKGLLKINGSGPRFHINSIEEYSGSDPTPKISAQFFLNTEATGYFMRLTTGGGNYDGMEIQARTDPLAHGSSGGNVCNATGLASRFRDDGKWDWEKELKHPASTVYSTQYNSDAPLYSGGTIPLNKWIGMKFLTYNIDNNTRVKLETYIDTTSNVTSGAPANGGNWKLVGSMIDSGSNWPGGDISGCANLTQNMAVTQGHGSLLIRTDNESAVWKYLSVREISMDSATTAVKALTEKNNALFQYADHKILFTSALTSDQMIQVLDLSGHRLFETVARRGQTSVGVNVPRNGVYLISVGNKASLLIQ